jgi:hypothetical protein
MSREFAFAGPFYLRKYLKLVAWGPIAAHSMAGGQRGLKSLGNGRILEKVRK